MKSILNYKKTIIVIAILSCISFFLLLDISQTSLKKFSPVPSHANPDMNLLFNGMNEKVIGYQISKEGNKVIFLALNNSDLNVYVWKEETNQINKINDNVIPYVRFPDVAAFADSYMDAEGNIYFEAGLRLIKISNDLVISDFEYLSEDLLWTQDEVANLTKSRLFKRIVDKYSKEKVQSYIVAPYNLSLYLIDLDGGYYIVSESKTLSLERLPFEEETVDSVVPDEFIYIRYGARWNPETRSINEKAVIDSIIETVRQDPLILASSNLYEYELPNLLMEEDTYLIKNDKHSGKIFLFCYPSFEFIGDGNPCKGVRLFLRLNSKEYLLPNPRAEDYNSKYDSPFIYIPYDRRLFTKGGKFIFLSVNNKLYTYG